MEHPPNENWSEWQRYMIAKVDNIEDQVTLLRIDFAMLRVRSSLWGAAAGFIPATVAVITVLFSGVPG